MSAKWTLSQRLHWWWWNCIWRWWLKRPWCWLFGHDASELGGPREMFWRSRPWVR